MSANGGVLLLAAGKGTRFGSDKRLHTLADGDFVTLATAKRYASVFEQIAVVLRPGETRIAQALVDALEKSAMHPPTAVYATDAHLGMGHSLAAGVAAVGHWDYAFVALADMPFVETATLRILKHALTGGPQNARNNAPIVVPTFQGQPGHPVGFANDYFAELGQLGGDSGARKVIEANRNRVSWIEVDDPGVLRDIDRPEDLEAVEPG